MGKNVVICLDEGSNNSNIARLYSALQANGSQQVSFYHSPSVLTGIARYWKSLMRLAFGFGLMSDIAECYRFLMNHYEQGDRLFLFGYGRGACAARGLARMLHIFGLLRRGQDNLVPLVCRMFRRLTVSKVQEAARFKRTFSLSCTPHFVGLWDTVGTLGGICDAGRYPFADDGPEINIGRHALSIDERRRFFRENLWESPEVGRDIKQVWFAGVHGDVGGGYPELESGLSKISLEWMLYEAANAGLMLGPETNFVLGQTPPPAAFGPGWHAFKYDVRIRIVAQFWGTPPDVRAPMHRSLLGISWLLEFLPQRRLEGKDLSHTKWTVPMGRARRIPEGSLIHESVYIRLAEMGYRPKNLPQSYGKVPWEHMTHFERRPVELPFEEVVETVRSTPANSALAIAELLRGEILRQEVYVMRMDGSLEVFNSVWDIPADLATEITTDFVRIKIRG